MTREEIAAALREKARLLHEGRTTPHRSCGIAEIARHHGARLVPAPVGG